MNQQSTEVISRKMWIKVFLIAVGAFFVDLVATIVISKSRLDSENAKLVNELLADTSQSLT